MRMSFIFSDHSESAESQRPSGSVECWVRVNRNKQVCKNHFDAARRTLEIRVE